MTRKKEIAALCLLLFFSLLYQGAISIYLNKLSFPMGKDVFPHLMELELIQHQLDLRDDPDSTDTLASIFINKNIKYPPGSYIFAVIFDRNLNFFDKYRAYMASHFIYVFLFFIGVYLILGARLSPFASAFASLAVLCAPVVFDAACQFALSFPAAAMILVCLALVIRTPVFKRGWATALFGFAGGFGALTYYMVIPFLVGPVLYLLVGRFRTDNASFRKLAGHFLLFSIFFLAVCGRYFFDPYHVGLFLKELLAYPNAEVFGHEPHDWGKTLERLWVYSKMIITNVLPFVVIAVAVNIKKIRIEFNRLEKILLACAGFAMIFFTFFPGTHIGYLVAVVPLIAIHNFTLLSKFPRSLGLWLGVGMCAIYLFFPIYHLYKTPSVPPGTFPKVLDSIVDECNEHTRNCSVFWTVGGGWFADWFFMQHPKFDQGKKWETELWGYMTPKTFVLKNEWSADPGILDEFKNPMDSMDYVIWIDEAICFDNSGFRDDCSPNPKLPKTMVVDGTPRLQFKGRNLGAQFKEVDHSGDPNPTVRVFKNRNPVKTIGYSSSE